MARSFAQFRAQLPEFGAGACQLLAGQPLDRDQAHLERILRLDRSRLRGAKDEFLLATTAQNLRKLAKLVPLPAPTFAA